MSASSISNASAYVSWGSESSSSGQSKPVELSYADFLLKQMDTDHDGKVSKKELDAYTEKKKEEAQAKMQAKVLGLDGIASKMTGSELKSRSSDDVATLL